MTTSPEKNGQRQTAGKTSWNRTKTVAVIIVIIAVLMFARYMKQSGTGSQQTQTQPSMPTVITQTVVSADLAEEREYVGLVDPIQTVSLRPQVSGEIAQVHFKDGASVKAGELMFSIDNKQFQATVDARKADLDQAEANHDRASKYLARLKASDQRSVSASALETAESDMLQGQASVEQAKAALKTAQINLGYTKITAPISGRAGKALSTKGNYVTPASELATIVQIDPIRISFTLPDRDYINQLDMFKASGSKVFNATVRMANGDAYPEQGERDFENNQVDTATGTIRVSLRYKNADGLLVPGSMVRIAVKSAKTHVAAVIPQQSVMADKEGDYVYVVDHENKANIRRVSLGITYGVMREVLSGVEAGEEVIIRGLQAVRDGVEVQHTSQKVEGDTARPSELAKQSGYDLKPLSGDAGKADTQEPSEGKN